MSECFRSRGSRMQRALPCDLTGSSILVLASTSTSVEVVVHSGGRGLRVGRGNTLNPFEHARVDRPHTDPCPSPPRGASLLHGSQVYQDGARVLLEVAGGSRECARSDFSRTAAGLTLVFSIASHVGTTALRSRRSLRDGSMSC